MSTNKSENLNLHLWEPADDFIRSEFNENFSALDTAIAAEAAEVAELTEQVNTPPFVLGTYRGTNLPRDITVGFRPTLLVVWGGLETTDYDKATISGAYSGIFYEGCMKNSLLFTDTGFHIYESSYYPDLAAPRDYVYLAFH